MRTKIPTRPDDEAALTADILALAVQYGRYGYRRIAALLRAAGWSVNPKRVERIWRREGLKVPMKQPKRGRLWFNDGSCVRLRPERPNHVWSNDFVEDRTHEGRKCKRRPQATAASSSVGMNIRGMRSSRRLFGWPWTMRVMTATR